MDLQTQLMLLFVGVTGYALGLLGQKYPIFSAILIGICLSLLFL